MPAGDVWGNAWGDSWNASWAQAVAAVVAEPTPTTAGGGGRRAGATSWRHKTLEQLRDEKRKEIARLKRLARAKVKTAVEAGVSDVGYLQALAEHRIEHALPADQQWMPDPAIEQLAAEILAIYARAIERNREEEEDAEAFMLYLAGDRITWN